MFIFNSGVFNPKMLVGRYPSLVIDENNIK